MGDEATTSTVDALFNAAKAGYEDDTKELLALNVDVNSVDHQGNTAFHYAAGGGHLAVLNLLLSNPKANPNIANKLGDTPLHKAAARGGADIVKSLLGKGAEPSTNLSNQQGKKPKDLAKSAEVAALLEPVSVTEYPFEEEDEEVSDEDD